MKTMFIEVRPFRNYGAKNKRRENELLNYFKNNRYNLKLIETKIIINNDGFENGQVFKIMSDNMEKMKGFFYFLDALYLGMTNIYDENYNALSLYKIINEKYFGDF